MAQKESKQVLKIKRNTHSGISLRKRRTWYDEAGISTTSGIPQGEAVEHVVSSVPGTTQQQPEITEDMIKNHPLYRAILAESVERRQTIKKLEGQLKEAKPATETDSEKTAPSPGQPLTIEAVNKLVFDALAQVELKAKQDRLLDQHKVPVEARELWRDNDIDAMQKRLTAAFGGPQQGSSSPGNGSGNGDPHADIRARIRAGVRGDGENPGTRVYSPEKQRELGGGVVLN